jgi:large subunit ribosomal protein L25
LTIDVTSLGVGETIHVADLVGDQPYELVDEGRFTVVTINAPEAAAGMPEEEGVEEEGGEVTE